MSLIIRHLGLCSYPDTYRDMVAFTNNRNTSTRDEIWFLQHPQVYTLGQAGKMEHLLEPGPIPVIRTDRGGQVTYHGPGQLLGYLLIDLQRRQLNIKTFVHLIEQSILDLLQDLGLVGERKPGAPGVYIAGKKIAALGIRVRHGCSYHGLSLNVDLDLEPYRGINPCGYPGLEMTRLGDHGSFMNVSQSALALQPWLARNLGYNLAEVEEFTEPDSDSRLTAIA